MPFCWSVGAVLLIFLSSTAGGTPSNTSPEDLFDVTDKYIVSLKPEVNVSRHMIILQDLQIKMRAKRADGPIFTGVSHQYLIGDYQGYAGHFDKSVIEQLQHYEDIVAIEPDQILNSSAYTTHVVANRRKGNGKGLTQQVPAPVGLQIISHDGYDLPGKYFYDKTAGAGTFGYILDSGINYRHREFARGRVSLGYNAIRGAPDTDLDGHGTAMAGIMGGRKFGVAKKAHLIMVKVVQRISMTSIVLAGLEWTINDIMKKRRQHKSVVNMSLGGRLDVALNAGVNAVASRGIPVVVAAGNANQNAALESPASAQGAIAVAAIDEHHRRADFSNWGPAVTIFAPGVRIQSSWIGGNKAAVVMSGTSASSPFVAGLVLYLRGMMELPDTKTTRAKLLELAVKNKVIKPKYTTNTLAYNGSGK
ncbi:oryzin [Myriangium duriaei CBS 260.36]|uniref:Oryzin n=1 Tax=Myriangium duriaei CBS 260.36 TaxID=1168546 RepID=A0A9P4IPW7_9PEZI|nr:oryzin [Myriangium duriaei CBS 260.36]